MRLREVDWLLHAHWDDGGGSWIWTEACLTPKILFFPLELMTPTKEMATVLFTLLALRHSSSIHFIILKLKHHWRVKHTVCTVSLLFKLTHQLVADLLGLWKEPSAPLPLTAPEVLLTREKLPFRNWKDSLPWSDAILSASPVPAAAFLGSCLHAPLECSHRGESVWCKRQPHSMAWGILPWIQLKPASWFLSQIMLILVPQRALRSTQR